MYVIKVVICSCEVDPVGGELFPTSEGAIQEINRCYFWRFIDTKEIE
jgi:hypothetical protein